MVFALGCCSHCGVAFRYPREFGTVKYCSGNCRVEVEPPRHPWEYKGCVSSRYHDQNRRRALAAGDRIDLLVVYVAYDWTCGLCHGKIDPTLRMPDNRCATIDHIIPLASGGTHTWDNVQPAHKICNEDKDTLLYGINEGSNSERLSISVSR